ncbi:MAG: hypothetical protein ACF8MJ_01945 [Phycisphaerales bacterium JB050]
MENTRPPRIQRFGDRLALGLLRFAESISTHDVAIPWHQQVRFPDRCTRCARHNPDTTFTATYTRPSPLNVAFGLALPSHRKRITAPVCTACHAECVRRRRLQRFIPFPLLATLILSGMYAASLLRPFAPTLSVVMSIAAVLGSVTIAIAVSIAIGDPFPTSQGKDDLTFHFKSPDLAHDFAVANNLEVTEPEPIPDLAFPSECDQSDAEDPHTP